MKFLSNRRRHSDPAETAQQQQRAEYDQALTRILNHAADREPDAEPSRNGPWIRRPQS